MDEAKKPNQERLKEITDSIEAGIKDLFASDKYRAYLQTMSRFHRYSVNNILLIHMQKPTATRVASFKRWQDTFGRSVKKGEKGIKIIAPVTYTKKVECVKLDPDTGAPLLDSSGQAILEEKEIRLVGFKVVPVFDVAQTTGKPLPQLAATLIGDVQQYDLFMEALRRASPVPMEFKPLPQHTDGFFNLKEQSITLREGMSEKQTICAAIHEMSHALLHNSKTADDKEKPDEKRSRNTEEVEAESIAYAVCAYYGIDTGENSFGYIASWSSDKDLKELRASLETINKTASRLIEGIDRNFAEICKEQDIDQAMPDNSYAIYQLNDTPEAHNRYYLSYDRLERDGISPNISTYDRVYSGELSGWKGMRQTLEGLFYVFNTEQPADFGGHALSVSDVVAVKRDGAVSYHYCDSIGFRELPNFMARTDTAVRRENVRRPSVLAALKQPAPPQELKTAPKKGAEMER